MSTQTHQARRLGALFTALVGLINILSALYPAIPGRMAVLREVLPSHFIRGSQTAALVVGFLLIVVADGLRKRRRRAMQVTVALLLLSALLNLAKGLDYEEAIIGVILAVGLTVCRTAFPVRGRLPTPARLVQHAGVFASVYYGYVLAGFLILRRHIAPVPSLPGATIEPFRLVLGVPQYHYLSAQARWFDRSLIILGAVAILAALAELLRPIVPRPTGAELERVHGLVRRYGSDTLSYFACQHGRSYFFDESGQAFLSYRLWRSVAIVAGNAIGPVECLPGLIATFIEFCSESGIEPCFLGIAARDLPTYSNLGLRTVKVGEEAIIDLPSFDRNELKRKVRRAARHAEELGVHSLLRRRADIEPELLHQMEAIHRQWIAERGGHERGFSMTLGRLPGEDDPDCEVALAVQAGSVLGFLSLVPAYGSGAWSLDAMRRRHDAPNGLTEFLVIRAAEEYRDRGFRTLSLNFATLSNSQDDIDSRALENTRRFLYEHLSSVYQLRSLEQFNDKFAPCWQSRYLAYRDVLQIPRLAFAIAQSEDPIRLPSPLALLRRLSP